MKFTIIACALILIGYSTQNDELWDNNWSNETFNISGDNNLSLDSLLAGQTQSSNLSTSSMDNMDWQNSNSSDNQMQSNLGSFSDLDWSNNSNSSNDSNNLDWLNNSSSSTGSSLDWSNVTSNSTNLDWSSTASTNTSQTVDTNTYVNSDVYYDKPQITQTQTLVSKPVVQKKVISQPIITQKIIQQPIIKQRIVQTPIVRKKVVQRPVYTETQNLQPIVDNKVTTRTVPINVPGKTTIRETYYQPTVLTKDVQLQINRGQTQYNNMPVQTQPVQYSEEVINKVVQAPAKEIYTQPIYQKQIVNNSETVNFVKQQPVYQQNAPIYREPLLQERTRYETITRPGREIYNNTYIQPIVQRENVNVQYNRQPDRQVQLDQIIAPAQYNTRTRTETISVPGNQIITQPVVQKMIYQNDIHHIQQPVVQRVAVHRPYPVPTPVIKKVPIVRRIPVPVLRKRNSGTKIINLNKVTINGGRSGSYSEDYSQDYGYDNYWNNYHQNLNRYRRNSIKLPNVGGRFYQTNGQDYDTHSNYYNYGSSYMSPYQYNKQNRNYMSYPNYSKNYYGSNGADLHYGRSYNQNNYKYGNYNKYHNNNYSNYWNNNHSPQMSYNMYGTHY